VESLVFSLTSSGLSFTYNLVVNINAKGKKGKKGSTDKTGPAYFG